MIDDIDNQQAERALSTDPDSCEESQATFQASARTSKIRKRPRTPH